MASGEELATYGGILEQLCGLQIFQLDGCFVIVELPDEVVVSVHCRPTEKGIGLLLHGALSIDDAASLVLLQVAGLRGNIGGVAGWNLLFDLEKEGIFGAVAFHHDAVVAKSHGTCSDNFESNIDGLILCQKVAALGQQIFRIG